MERLQLNYMYNSKSQMEKLFLNYSQKTKASETEAMNSIKYKIKVKQKADSVSISIKTKIFHKAMELYEQLPEIRPEEVEEAQERLESGNPPSSNEIAQSIILQSLINGDL